MRLKRISNPYHPLEAGGGPLRAWTLRPRRPNRVTDVTRGKFDAIYCVLVVAAAVLVGIVKCTTCGPRGP